MPSQHHLWQQFSLISVAVNDLTVLFAVVYHRQDMKLLIAISCRSAQTIIFYLQETEGVAMLTSVVQKVPSMKEEENQKLESYQKEIEHVKVCHFIVKVMVM